MYFADDIEGALKHSSSSEKQFATAPSTGFSGGATRSSDPLDQAVQSDTHRVLDVDRNGLFQKMAWNALNFQYLM